MRPRDRGTVITTSDLRRNVGAEIEVEVNEATILDFQIAVARLPGIDVSESLAITFNGKSIDPRESIGERGSRTHRVQGYKGTLTFPDWATGAGQADPAPVRDIDL